MHEGGQEQHLAARYLMAMDNCNITQIDPFSNFSSHKDKKCVALCGSSFRSGYISLTSILDLHAKMYNRRKLSSFAISVK